MNVFGMAVRNIGRNRTRTFTTVGAMAFACALMILYSSLVEGFLNIMVRNAVGMSISEIQIHAKGYRNDPDLYKKIENYSGIISKLELEGFKASPRLYGFGLAAAGSSSSGVSLQGVDIVREPGVTQLYSHVAQGKWLDKSDPKGVVIGGKLSRSLGVGVGGEVIIISQAADGSMANDLYTVRGILKSVGEVIDRGGFLMLASTFRELMVVPEGAHEIAIVRSDDGTTLNQAMEKVIKIAPGLEVKSWRELQPVIARMLDTTDASLFIMLLITYMAIGMVTLNAILMSVFERIREFGVMKAIGVTPAQIVLIVFTEALAQAVIACVLALVAGLSVSYYFQSHGIDLSSISGVSAVAAIGGVAIDPIWYTKVTLASVTFPVVTLVVIVVLAAIYPAGKAALIQPVKAIHHI